MFYLAFMLSHETRYGLVCYQEKTIQKRFKSKINELQHAENTQKLCSG